MTFSDYLARGWRLCAIPPGSKGPRTKGWNAPNAAQPTFPPGHGAGLCHAWSGTCAVDVDNYEVARAWLIALGINLDLLLVARDAVMVSSGRSGRAKLLYALPSPLASVQLAPYQKTSEATGKVQTFHGLELRCASAEGLSVQDVLPPSIHPDTGRPYEWRYGDELLGDWRNLPPLPAALEALWRAQLAPTREAPAAPAAPTGAGFPELETLLAGQDPDTDYDSWLRVGMALHHETKGSGAGYALFDAWSARGAKYQGRQDTETKWASFSASTANPVTLGSLRRERVAALDDFPIVPAGTIDPSEDARSGATVKQLLESRLVFIGGQDCYYDMQAKGSPWLSDRSVRHSFCPYMPEVTAGDRVVRLDPVEYMKNSSTKLAVDAVGIHPGAGRLYSEDGTRYINRYMPRAVEPLRPLLHEREAFDFMWSRMKDDVFRRWLMMFYGHAVQKPGIKITSAPLLFSEAQGTGKNTIAKLLPELLFGAQWVKSMPGDVLSDRFNDAVGETWWLYLEELRSGNTKMDRIHSTNKIKSWITDDFITVRAMYLKPFDIRNRLQITATSNFDDAVQLDNNDRRWAVCEMGAPLSEREGLDLYGFLRSDRAPGVLRHIFGAVDLTGFQPAGRAPVTFAKRVMIRAGVGQWESTLVERMVSAAPPFDRDVFYVSDVQDMVLGRNGPSAVHLGRVLAKPPFNCVPLPNYAHKRMWCWRNVALWSDQTDAKRREYLQTGTRPAGANWSDAVPPLIRELSVDETLESANHPCSDLL